MPTLGKRKQRLAKAGLKEAGEVQQVDQHRQARMREQAQAIDDLEPLKRHEFSALKPLNVKAHTAARRRSCYIKNIQYHLDTALKAKSRLDRALALHSARARKRELLDDQESLHAQTLGLSNQKQNLQVQKSHPVERHRPSAQQSKGPPASNSHQMRIQDDTAPAGSHQPISTFNAPMKIDSTPFNFQKKLLSPGTKSFSPLDLTPNPGHTSVRRNNEPFKFDSLSTQTNFAHSSTKPSYEYINNDILPGQGYTHAHPSQSLFYPESIPLSPSSMRLAGGHGGVDSRNVPADPNFWHTGPIEPSSTNRLLHEDTQHARSLHNSGGEPTSRSASSGSLDFGHLANITPEQLFEGMRKSGRS